MTPQESRDEGWSGFGRRRLIVGAGIAASAAAAGVAVGGRDEAAAVPAAVTAINVQSPAYGASGDGKTDDRAAIQRALDDVGDDGGAVFLPPGDYLVGGALAPRSRTLVFGSHTPRWDKVGDPPSACRIRAAADFDGDGLLAPEPDTVAVTLRNVALLGGDQDGELHGIVMPDGNALSWSLEGMTVAGFGGDALRGRFHTSTLHNCFLHNNGGWGVNASGGDHWNDCHVSSCFIYFNRAGNLYFGGSEISAAVQFVNCRFERAGTNPVDVFAPLNPAAPGVRLASARYIHFANCDTDANTGNGFEILREAESPPGPPHYIVLSNCRFGRDGTGRNAADQESAEEFAGLKVLGSGDGRPSQVKLANCLVTYGKASDSGEGTILAPRYGVWYENTSDFQWMGGSIAVAPEPGHAAYHVGDGQGGNERPAIVDFEHGILTLPSAPPSENLPVPDGAVYLDLDAGRLNVRSAGSWRSVRLS